jgi:hypothetical protein
MRGCNQQCCAQGELLGLISANRRYSAASQQANCQLFPKPWTSTARLTRLSASKRLGKSPINRGPCGSLPETVQLASGNGSARLSRLNWVMVTSMLKTLAGKYGSSVSKMARKYAATVETPYGPRRCFQVSVERGGGKKPLVARYGGIPLRRQKSAVLTDRVQALTQSELVRHAVRHKELVSRLLAGRCEICGSTEAVQVHQVRKLADLIKAGQHALHAWMAMMVRRRRKTLIVCRNCHTGIHVGQPAISLVG